LDLKFHRGLILAQGAQVAAQQDPAVPDKHLNKKGQYYFFNIAPFLFIII